MANREVAVSLRDITKVFGTVKANNKDTIEISDLGMYLNKVNSSEDKDRLEKIAEIKSKIENNTYRIDSNELAKKIIERTKGEI